MNCDDIAAIIVGLLLILFVFVGRPIISIVSETRTCKNQATAMGFDYEFEWYVIGENICTYILPDGKRIISTKYRALENEQ